MLYQLTLQNSGSIKEPPPPAHTSKLRRIGTEMTPALETAGYAVEITRQYEEFAGVTLGHDCIVSSYAPVTPAGTDRA